MDNRILLIDDEPDILSTLEMTLNQEAYPVATATGGEAALELFRKQPFDLVITDMRMPGIDGVEVIRRVKALDPDVEVVMLTGYATLENAVTVLRNVGAFDYLTKPLEDIDELLMVVEKALEKRRLTLENRALFKNLKEKEAELARQNQVLRESERKYRELADTLPVNLFETDAKGTLTFLNPFALERFQYTREDLEKGLHVRDVLDEKQWEKTQKDARKRIAEKSFEAIESVAKRKDGTTFPVWVSIHPIFRENRFLGLRGFSLDITDRNQRTEGGKQE
jgi:PAS domain S-box-containing protein